MFKTTDNRTAKSFEQKEGYKIVRHNYGEWFIFLPDEKIPKNILQAQQIDQSIINTYDNKEIRSRIRELKKLKRDSQKKSQLRRNLNRQIRTLKKQLRNHAFDITKLKRKRGRPRKLREE